MGTAVKDFKEKKVSTNGIEEAIVVPNFDFNQSDLDNLKNIFSLARKHAIDDTTNLAKVLVFETQINDKINNALKQNK